MDRHATLPLFVAQNDGAAPASPEVLQRGAEYLTWQLLHYSTPPLSYGVTVNMADVAFALLEADVPELRDMMFDTFKRASRGIAMANRLAGADLKANPDPADHLKLKPLPAYNPAGGTTPVFHCSQSALLQDAARLFERRHMALGTALVQQSLLSYARSRGNSLN